jgi:hypothetical protein
MGYKMKGSSFYGKNSKSPAKQLTADRMRSPEEKAFYEDYEASKDYKPVPTGTYRGIGSFSEYTGPDEKFDWDSNDKPRKTGDVVSKGVAGSNKKENPRMGPVINEAEYQKRYDNLPPRASYSDDDYKAKNEARTKAYSQLTNAERGTEIKPKKKKK